jgi:hypothetical protein
LRELPSKQKDGSRASWGVWRGVSDLRLLFGGRFRLSQYNVGREAYIRILKEVADAWELMNGTHESKGLSAPKKAGAQSDEL